MGALQNIFDDDVVVFFKSLQSNHSKTFFRCSQKDMLF